MAARCRLVNGFRNGFSVKSRAGSARDSKPFTEADAKVKAAVAGPALESGREDTIATVVVVVVVGVAELVDPVPTDIPSAPGRNGFDALYLIGWTGIGGVRGSSAVKLVVFV